MVAMAVVMGVVVMMALFPSFSVPAVFCILILVLVFAISDKKSLKDERARLKRMEDDEDFRAKEEAENGRHAREAVVVRLAAEAKAVARERERR